MKVGITGSLSSGKSSVAKLLSKNKNLFFSADNTVKNLYSNNQFKSIIKRKLKIKSKNVKKEIKIRLLNNTISLKELGAIIHPFVRRKMRQFYKRNKNRKILIFEIPLLIESKLMNFFDYVILVAAPKKIRLKRYLKNGGEQKMFYLLDNNQISIKKKARYCDYLIVNNKSKKYLRKKITGILTE